MLLYKDGKTAKVPDIDAPAWLRQGWATEPQPVPAVETQLAIAAPAEPEPTGVSAAEQRYDELLGILDAEGWRAIKDIAGNYDIAKPSDGWDAAIPLIVRAEYGESPAP